MNFMKLIIFGIFFSVLWWLIIFTSNPYTFCKDHPETDLRDDYYLCEPFGFAFPKGKLEASNQPSMPWSGKGYRNSNPAPGTPEFNQQRRAQRCADPAFRRTEHGKEVCGGE